MTRNLTVTALVAVLIAGFVITAKAFTGSVTPPVTGYLEGQQIQFSHTETSDAKVADLLTKMKSSPVLVVPSLAQASDVMLASVYVFTNGVKGAGPLGYQPDVFDNPPGTPGYSPLRRLNLVTWKSGASVRELKSAAEVKEAEARSEVTIEHSGVVINMPLLTWPGGQR